MGKERTNSASYPLTSTCALWHTHVNTYAQMHRHTKKVKENITKNVNLKKHTRELDHDGAHL